jgi:hypothetical protein
MCNIEHEHQKIERLLENALSHALAVDADAFATCYKALLEHYDIACPDECIKKKCLTFLDRHRKEIQGSSLWHCSTYNNVFVCGW